MVLIEVDGASPESDKDLVERLPKCFCHLTANRAETWSR